MKKTIYAVAASHLDTSWEWTLETTCMKFLTPTIYDNFTLFDKYPDYVFGWEGAYRYELLEEYFPEAFEELKKRVAEGRWDVTGASYENGDVNQPSPEALFRNILYGQRYFLDRFGKKSNDIFLPDCFGFGRALPSVARHAGLKGFMTQKLTWGSAYGIPFDLGKWYGIDGSWIYAYLRYRSYGQKIEWVEDMRKDEFLLDKLNENSSAGIDFTADFFGVGDKGGAPEESSVSFVQSEHDKNPDSDIDVEFTTSVRLFDKLDELDTESRDSLPSWDNELLLTDHGVGSYTSRTTGSRWNKNSERLADISERANVAASLLGVKKYPTDVFDTAWKRVIAHQFHDDITGTSLMTCYNRSWNDYMLSMNQFAEEYRSAVGAIAGSVDTSFVKGVPVLVHAPVCNCGDSKGVVSVPYVSDSYCRYVRVFDPDGAEVPSQLSDLDGKRSVVFEATVPSMGFVVYDIRPSDSPYQGKDIAVNALTLSNDLIRISLNDRGNVCSVKSLADGREYLSSEITESLFAYDGNDQHPAWELDLPELSVPPKQISEATRIDLIENGPVRAVVRVEKKIGLGTLSQYYILEACSDVLRCDNELDWRNERSLLKVCFPSSCQNDTASYDLGLGVQKRNTNNEKVYECPAQVWADITDVTGDHGLAVFSDSRTGWDKPDEHTLRLTVVHTPKNPRLAASAHNLLDLGLNRYGWAVYPHCGSWQGSVQNKALDYNEPMTAFILTGQSDGTAEPRVSFASVNNDGVIVRAVKAAQDGTGFVVRFNESDGKEKNKVRFSMYGGISSADEIYATEEYLGEACVDNNELVFDLSPYQVRSFRIIPSLGSTGPEFNNGHIDLPYNINAQTVRGEDPDFDARLEYAIPSELVPDLVSCGGVDFRLVKESLNAVSCAGQKLRLSNGCNRLYLLAACVGTDKITRVKFFDRDIEIKVPSMTEPLALWDMIGLAQTGRIKTDTLAWNTTHADDRQGVVYCKQLYFFKIGIDIPSGADELTLPDDPDIIVLAATCTDEKTLAREGRELFDTLESRDFDYYISVDGYLALRPDVNVENFRKRIIDGKPYVSAKLLARDNAVYSEPRNGRKG